MDPKFNELFLPDRPAHETLPALDSPALAMFTALPAPAPIDGSPSAAPLEFMTGSLSTEGVSRHAPFLVSLVAPGDSSLVRMLKTVFACPVAFGEEVFMIGAGVVADLLVQHQEVVRPRVEASGVVHALLGAITHRALPILRNLAGVGKVLKAVRTVHMCVVEGGLRGTLLRITFLCWSTSFVML
jgi:hypothetical protein